MDDRKSVCENKEEIDAVLESLEVSKNDNDMNISDSDMIIYHAKIYKNLSRYKEALRCLKQLSNYHEMKKIFITEIILEYASERESTQNFREAEKLYKKILEMKNAGTKVSIEAIERLKENNSVEGKDQDLEELEILLGLREDVEKSVKQLTLQSMSSLEDLLEIGLVQLEDENNNRYNCIICDICVFGKSNVIAHLGSKKHKKKIDSMIKPTHEDPDYNSVEGKDQELEELEILLGLRVDVKKSVKQLTLQSMSSLEDLLEIGLIQLEDEENNKYNCTICDICVFGKSNVTFHVRSKNHKKTIERMIKPTHEDPNYLREDIKEGLKTGIIVVNSDKSKNYDCTACKKTFSGVDSLSMHMNSEKHKLRLIKQASMRPKKKIDESPLEEAIASGKIKWIDERNVYNCETCDTIIIFKNNAIQHVIGKKHEMALKKKKLSVKSTCSVLLGSIPKQATEADVIDCISVFGMIRSINAQLERNCTVIEMFKKDDAEAIVAAHALEKIKILSQDIEVKFSKEQTKRKVSHILHFTNIPKKHSYTSLIELVSLYGEVSGVKFLTAKEREGGHKALVEMANPDAAMNLMNNLDKIQKQGQNIIVNYSHHKYLKSCRRPQDKPNKPCAKPLDSKGNFSGANTTELANEIKIDHQLPIEKSEKLLQPDYLINAKREISKSNLSSTPGVKVSSFTSPSPVPVVSKPAVVYNANLFTQNILPGSLNESICEPIQPGKIRQDLSTDITHSLNLSSGTAEEIKSFMSSMSGEQKDIWEQRFGDHVSRMEQEIENALANPTTRSTEDNYITNPAFAESKKRKIFNEVYAHTNMKDFSSRKTIDHPDNRPGSSSNDAGISYESKRKKILLEDEYFVDKSKFNLIARGLSIDRTIQEVKVFFSNYGIIKDVHLEWSENPTFVGEQTAYIAFKRTDDAFFLLNHSQNLYIKDCLISIQMYTDSSKTDTVVILVSGITQVFNDSKRELFDYFNMFGSVKTVLLNTKTRDSHYAFLLFHSKEVAKEIVSSKEQYVFNNDILTLKEAKIYQDEKKFEKLEITQKAVSVPADKVNPLIKQSVNILKEIMIETGATYEFVLNQHTSINQTLTIHGTPEQIFLAKKNINEKLRMQSRKLPEKESEKDPPKMLIITDNIYEILESICLKEVDLELDTCVRILENMTLSRLYSSVSLILNELIGVKYVIIVFGVHNLTKNVNISKGFFNVPKENFVVINDFLEQSQDVSERLRNQFRGVKFFWTTPSPYSYEKYNRQIMPNNKYARPQLIPSECWRSIQSNFHKCLINLRMKMLQSDPHFTIDFLKLFLYNNKSSDDLSGEALLLKGEVSMDSWFDEDCNMKLNTEGGRALRYCIRKAIQRQILWGSDSEGKSEWFDYVKDMLDKEQQERDCYHRDLQPITIPNIEEILQIYGAPVDQHSGIWPMVQRLTLPDKDNGKRGKHSKWH